MFDIEETELERKLSKLQDETIYFFIDADLCMRNDNFIKRLDESINILSDVTQEEIKQEVKKRKNNLWDICGWCMFIQELYNDIGKSIYELSLITRKTKCSKKITRNKFLDAMNIVLEIRYWTCDEICRLTEEKASLKG